MLKFMLGGGVYYVLKVWGSINFVNLKWVLVYWCFDVMVVYCIDKYIIL